MTLVIPKILTSTGHPFQDIQGFLSAMKPVPYTIIFNNLTGGRFSSPNGFVYEIQPHTFANIWGNPINEEITLEIFETIDKRSLFFSNISCTADNQLLDVDWSVDIQVKKHKDVGVRQRLAIRVLLPIPKNRRWGDLEIFEEQTAKVNFLNAEERKEWTSTSLNLFMHRLGQQKEYFFYVSGPGTYLIGKKLRVGRKPKSRAMLSIFLKEESPRLRNLRAFLIFHESDTIIQLEAQRGRFSAFHLPKGRKASLLLVGLENRHFYFNRYFLGTLSNTKIGIDLQKVTVHQLQAELQRMIF